MGIDQFIIYLPAFILIITFALSPILWQAKRSWRVTVDEKALTIEKPAPSKKDFSRIPVGELEELLVGNPVPPGGAGKL